MMPTQASYAALAARPAPPSPSQTTMPGVQVKLPRVTPRIAPATEGRTYPKPGIVDMNRDQRGELFNGYLTELYMDSADASGTPMKLTFRLHKKNTSSVPLAFLCALSPVFKEQVHAAAQHPSQVEQTALPHVSIEAYELFMTWCNNVIDVCVLAKESKPLTRMFVPFPRLEIRPLTKYYGVLQIAKKLAITPLVDDLQYRFDTMIIYVPGSWNIDPADVRKVYEELKAGHELREKIADGIAKAWLRQDLRRKGTEIYRLTFEFEEFWADLQQRGVKE